MVLIEHFFSSINLHHFTRKMERGELKLPSDVWRIIITYIPSSNHDPSEVQFYQHAELAFISSVSKRINALCNAYKIQLGIQNVKEPWWMFQYYLVALDWVSCLVYVHQNCGRLHEEIEQVAIEQGSLECLKYILEHGGYFDSSSLITAAENGHLGCIRYLLDRGAQWHNDILAVAAEKGHLFIIKYFNEKEDRWDPAVCYSAIYGGQLEILKYAHEAGRAWPNDVCTRHLAQSEIARLICLKYVHDTSPKSHQCSFRWEEVCSWLSWQGFTVVERGGDVFVSPPMKL